MAVAAKTKMKPLALIPVLLFAGCAAKPAAFGPRVQGIRESQAIQQQQAATITQAAAQSRAAGKEIRFISTLAMRAADKNEVVRQWEDYQLRKKYKSAPQP